MLVSLDDEGRLFATHSAVEMPWACPANPAGHRTHLLVNWEDTPELKAAWQAYDAIARALPECEHVTAWHAEVEAARKIHHKAIRARDKLWKEQQKAAQEALEAAEDA